MGAGGTRSYQMAKALVRRGHSVLVVCGAAEGALLPLPEVRPGMRRGTIEEFEVLQFALRYSNYDSFLWRMLVFFRFGWASIGVAVREGYDLLFATSTPLTAALPGIVMKLFHRRPFVFEVRDPWPDVPRAMGIIRSPFLLGAAAVLERLTYRLADSCIGLSPGMTEIIKERSPLGKPIRMIPNGCDLDVFRPEPEKDPAVFGLSGGVRFVALYAGAHGLANGLDAVLDAAAEVRRRGRNDVAFVFIGEGRERPKLERRAQEEELHNCHFLGAMPKDHVTAKMAHANAGLMIFANIPVFYHGTSPNKFFDYIATGLPVVCNYPGWMQEMIEESHCGIGCPPGRPDVLADAILNIADNPNRASSMARRARCLAEERFDRNELASKFIRCLEDTERSYREEGHRL